MKRMKLSLAFLDRWETVDAYEAFTYEGHQFYVHHLPNGKAWKVSHSCGAAAGIPGATRQEAISNSLEAMKARGTDKTQLDYMVANFARLAPPKEPAR